MKGSPKIIETLNMVLEFEIGDILQSLHDHRTADGIESAEGNPSPKPAPVKTHGTLRKMMQDALEGAYGAIERYRTAIRLADELGEMMEEIVATEEQHADTWETNLRKTGTKLR